MMEIIKNKDRKKIAASMGLLFAAFVWGFAFVVVKTSLDIVPPIYMLAFRFTIASVALCIIFHKKLKHITRQTIFMGFVLGFFLFTGYVVQTIGCKYTTAGKNAFLTTIYVILVPFLHWLISRKKLNKYNLLAAILALVGIGLLSLQGDLSINIGDGLTLLCGLLFSFQIIYIDKYTETEDPILLTVLQIIVAAVFSWILAPIMDGSITNIPFNSQAVVSMLYLGIFSTMIAFLIQNVCQKFTHPATASILLSMESVFGVLCSVIFLGEVLTIKMMFGCMIMFGAIILSQTKGSEGT